MYVRLLSCWNNKNFYILVSTKNKSTVSSDSSQMERRTPGPAAKRNKKELTEEEGRGGLGAGHMLILGGWSRRP